jgi:RluA family pseudouridine synthase
MKRLKVDKNIDLKTFLSEKLKISKNKAKEIIDNKNVFVNNKRTWIASYELKKGDIVEVSNVFETISDENLEKNILYEDKFIIAVNKPPFLESNKKKQSVEYLIRKIYKNNKIEAIHRLDRETTGVLLFAKNKSIFEKFKENWNKITDKYYLAIVHGEVKFKKKIVNFPIDKKIAKSEIKRLSVSKDFSLVEVKIKTGRKHQIRIHLAKIGHPIVGDKTYGFKIIENPLLKNINRHMLHAHRLELYHPFLKKKIKIKAPLYKDFEKLKEKLRL